MIENGIWAVLNLPGFFQAPILGLHKAANNVADFGLPIAE